MNHRQLILLLVAVLFPFLSVACDGSSHATEGATVARVIDGDTIVVDIGGSEATVRLLGVDTPETVHPSQPVECFGPEAAAFTKSLLPPGSPVHLERDQEEIDVFGRLLLYVHRIDGAFVNEELLAGGFARFLVIPPNDAYAPRLRAAESHARETGAGLWSACDGRATEGAR